MLCYRSHAIACVNQFIISRTEVLMLHIDSFIEVSISILMCVLLSAASGQSHLKFLTADF